jgi:hypothetical protein
VKRLLFGCCALLVIVTLPASAQTRFNPDISLVGDFRFDVHNDPARPVEYEKFNFRDPELELVVGGYLNPYARADATIAWHLEHAAEVEEIYATFLRGVPLGTNLRIGQYLLEFGRLNPQHPHAYAFIERPLPHSEFFGDHGLIGVTVRGAWLLPTGDAYTELMLAPLKGDILAGHHHHEADSSDAEEHSFPVAGFGRLTTALGVSENAELAVGVSGLTAIHDPAEKLRAWLGGFDLKYKWLPSRNTSFTFEGEALLNHRELEGGGDVTTWGSYAYFDYRFRQRYNVGAIGEYTQGALDASEEIWRAGAFVGFAPVEETSLFRLVGNWTEPEGAEGYWTFTLQLVFGLGPHQPHAY